MKLKIKAIQKTQHKPTKHQRLKKKTERARTHGSNSNNCVNLKPEHLVLYFRWSFRGNKGGTKEGFRMKNINKRVKLLFLSLNFTCE